MKKDFDTWNESKKKIHNERPSLFCFKREIWWCSIGLNVGSEEDGKNELFERPVLVLKVLNNEMVRIAPLTSQIKDDENHVPITYSNSIGTVKLSQIKTVSTRRFTRKISRLDSEQFEKVKEIVRTTIV